MKQMKLRTKKLLVKKWLKKFGKGENWKQNFGRKNMNNSKNETICENRPIWYYFKQIAGHYHLDES